MIFMILSNLMIFVNFVIFCDFLWFLWFLNYRRHLAYLSVILQLKLIFAYSETPAWLAQRWTQKRTRREMVWKGCQVFGQKVKKEQHFGWTGEGHNHTRLQNQVYHHCKILGRKITGKSICNIANFFLSFFKISEITPAKFCRIVQCLKIVQKVTILSILQCLKITQNAAFQFFNFCILRHLLSYY